MAGNLAQAFFGGVSYQIVGIVLALLVFDAFKEGVLLPIFNGIYHPRELRRGTEIEYEASGALVVVRGPFRFRIGYLVSRLLLFAALLLVALPCMWRWRRGRRGRGRARGDRSGGLGGEEGAEASEASLSPGPGPGLDPAAAAPGGAVAADKAAAASHPAAAVAAAHPQLA